jgi:hypothetical protein
VLAGLLAGIPAVADDTENDRVSAAFEAAIANPDDPALVAAFIRELPEVPAGSGRYIVEGDIGISEAEIVPYLGTFNKRKTERPGELLVNTLPGGEFDYWSDPAHRHLTYAIDHASFGDRGDEVGDLLGAATKRWVGVCPECGISFEEKSEQEAGPGFANVVFVVRFIDDPSGPIARAFFPSTAPIDRVLEVFPEFFSPTMLFDRVGVFRHELGHVLGYRHEHIDHIPGCKREGGQWTPLAPYTAKSVMHYLCGGGGSFFLDLQPNDIAGHHCLYVTGKPCPVASP